MTRNEGKVKKGWGEEVIFATNDHYCGKLLKFNKGAKFSMHFHKEKHESWYVLEGEFVFKRINTQTAEVETCILKKDHIVRNEPCQPHQLYCLKEGIIIEVSTPDSIEDNYRIAKGDSQKS